MKTLLLITLLVSQSVFAIGIRIDVPQEEIDRIYSELEITKEGFILQVENKFSTRTFNLLEVSVCEEDQCTRYNYRPISFNVLPKGGKYEINFKQFAKLISYYNIQRPALRFAVYNGMTTQWSAYKWDTITFAELTN